MPDIIHLFHLEIRRSLGSLTSRLLRLVNAIFARCLFNYYLFPYEISLARVVKFIIWLVSCWNGCWKIREKRRRRDLKCHGRGLSNIFSSMFENTWEAEFRTISFRNLARNGRETRNSTEKPFLLIRNITGSNRLSCYFFSYSNNVWKHVESGVRTPFSPR